MVEDPEYLGKHKSLTTFLHAMVRIQINDLGQSWENELVIEWLLRGTSAHKGHLAVIRDSKQQALDHLNDGAGPYFLMPNPGLPVYLNDPQSCLQASPLGV